MTKRIIFLLWVFLLLGYLTLSSFGQMIGQDAPPLRIAKWIKGEAIEQLEKDHIYVVAGVFHIPAGVTMTIEPGTILAFKQHMGFYVEGTLVALGTAQQPILMTGEEKIRGFWFGVNFHNSDNYKNILEYVTIEYGGSDPPAFGIPANLSLTTNTTVGSRVSANNCTLRESARLTTCVGVANPSLILIIPAPIELMWIRQM